MLCDDFFYILWGCKKTCSILLISGFRVGLHKCLGHFVWAITSGGQLTIYCPSPTLKKLGMPSICLNSKPIDAGERENRVVDFCSSDPTTLSNIVDSPLCERVQLRRRGRAFKHSGSRQKSGRSERFMNNYLLCCKNNNMLLVSSKDRITYLFILYLFMGHQKVRGTFDILSPTLKRGGTYPLPRPPPTNVHGCTMTPWDLSIVTSLIRPSRLNRTELALHGFGIGLAGSITKACVFVCYHRSVIVGWLFVCMLFCLLGCWLVVWCWGGCMFFVFMKIDSYRLF